MGSTTEETVTTMDRIRAVGSSLATPAPRPGNGPTTVIGPRREARPVAARFGILGPVEFGGASGPVVIRGAKRRALLIRLLVSANQPVPMDRLAEDIWDGCPGPGAASTLVSHISLLRKLIGAERIANHGGSYCLGVARDELDAEAFESAGTEGRRALELGDLRRAADLFAEGLGLWRGPALADVAGASWAQGAIARLEELRLSAEESLLDARIGLGMHREVVAAAEAAVDTQPLREQRWATFMLALYRSGRQADALRTYQRLRALLGEELGLEPSTELSALEEAILRHSPELDRPDSLAIPSAEVNRAPAGSPKAPAHAEIGASGTAILLFTDWVDSTALSVSMPVEEADALRRTHFALLREALAQHAGREVKNGGRRPDGSVLQPVRRPDRGRGHAAGRRPPEPPVQGGRRSPGRAVRRRGGYGRR